MTNRASLMKRMLVEALVGVAAAAGFVLASRIASPVALIPIPVVLLIAASVGGYLEPSAKRVWLHAPAFMLPELIALPVVLATCRGFECAGFAAFLMAASLFTLVMMGASFLAFRARRHR
ncbi:MAG TPA: hypothetical protein VKR61_07610 [Bryobacteraceae bacterium]|nr:hypothetical protein [Bryobacteraceae bacterium]